MFFHLTDGIIDRIPVDHWFRPSEDRKNSRNSRHDSCSLDWIKRGLAGFYLTSRAVPSLQLSARKYMTGVYPTLIKKGGD